MYVCVYMCVYIYRIPCSFFIEIVPGNLWVSSFSIRLSVCLDSLTAYVINIRHQIKFFNCP